MPAAVRLEPVPVLRRLRDLWSMPRDMARFHAYVEQVKSGADGELLAPLVAANPMAREHMLVYVDALLALDAEGLVAAACAEAEERLARSDLDTRVSLVPADNVGGAWSEMSMVDHAARFPDPRPNAGPDKYRFVTAIVFATETPNAVLVRERVLAAIYRAAYIRHHGIAATIREMMRQEGNALRFAGVRVRMRHDLDGMRATLAPHLDATLHATRFAAMYGDAAARRLGHQALGLPDNAGFMVALDDAQSDPRPPEELIAA